MTTTDARSRIDIMEFKSRKRKMHSRSFVDCPVVDDQQLFDKLPNYCTALSIPLRAVAGSVASSSSDLVTKLIEQYNRDVSPERDMATTPSVLDKIPAYQSLFTNSTRYDNVSLLTYEPGCIMQSPFSDSHLSAQDFKTIPRANGCEPVFSEQKQIQYSERRIVHVGRIPRHFTSQCLKQIFEQFGEIEDCSVHFREHGDNYGFVTYVRTSDAFEAVENGNTLRGCESFDICFGGRRQFCRADYSDLDGQMVVREEIAPFVDSSSSKDLDFDDLLSKARKHIN